MNIPAKWKNIAAVVLIVLGCMVATVSVAIVWLNKVVLDSDEYVVTITPLSEDPAIKEAVANKITDELFRRTRAEDLAREALPEKVDFLAAPIVGATQGYVNEQIRKQLDSDEFVKIWKESNRKGHEILKQVLAGEKSTVYSEEGKVYLDLGALFEIVKARLADRGITIFENVRIEDTGTQFTIFEYQNIAVARQGIHLLSGLATWLPIISLALFGAAMWLSRNRWNTLFWIGLGFAAGMAVLLVGVAIGRGYYLDAAAAKKTLDLPAATSFFDIIAGSLKTTLRRAFAFGLAVATAGFIMGPYPLAVTIRASVMNLYRTGKEARDDLDMEPSGAWVAKQKGILRAAGIVLALVTLVVMDQPSLMTALLIAAILIVYIWALEFLARKGGVKHG
ncbi:MAG: hypothetical protein WC935_03125 [Thermoleophilia bacterium]